jgi:hypothetical protein
MDDEMPNAHLSDADKPAPVERKGWYGFDLDGTLAEYHGWVGPEHIGNPVPLMLARLIDHLDNGDDCRIFTARVDGGAVSGVKAMQDVSHIRSVIEAWCLKYVGCVLPVTNVKDFGMIALYDDRAIQVQPNTGICIQDLVHAQDVDRIFQ